MTRTLAQVIEAFEQSKLAAAKRAARPRRWWQPLTKMLDSILADEKAAAKAAKRARQQARRTA